jgi:DNA polymerase-4
MLQLPTATILHLDVDAFFASIEQRDDPSLRGQPVAVGTGVVASCSYEARRWGVRTGMRLAEARGLCRSLRVIPGDYRRYDLAGRRILAICLDRTAGVEVAALDDLYLDLTPAGTAPAGPGAAACCLAAALRRQIATETQLSVSIGIGTSKLIAAVATQEAKDRKLAEVRGQRSEVRGQEDGIACVPAGLEKRYLAPWPAEVLPGVGPQVQAQLERLNVRRVSDVAAMPLAVLCGLFGRRGEVLHQYAHGIDHRPVEPHRPPQSVSRRTSFDPPAAEDAFLEAMLDHLLERALSWLRLHELATRGLTLYLRYADHRGADGRVSFRQPTADEEFLKNEARDRFRRVRVRRLPLRLLGVELSPLQAPDPQGQLFADPAVERGQRLAACKETIRQRFGFMSLLPGSALELTGQVAHDRDNFHLRTPCLTR